MGFSVGKIAKTALGGVSGLLSSGESGLSAGPAGLVSGAVGVGMDLLSSAMNTKQQQALQDDAFNKNLQMWNLNNAYNDPAQQMARLKAAGLNPNLVYGGGNVTGNTSGSIPTYEAANYTPVDKSTQRAQLALALQEHQQRVTNQAIENELARERIGLAQRDADRQDRLADAQIKAYAANLGLTNARIGDIEYQHEDKPSSEIGKTVSDAVKGVKKFFRGYKEAGRGPKHGINFLTGERF